MLAILKACLVLLLAVALLATACSSDSGGPTSADGSTGSAVASTPAADGSSEHAVAAAPQRAVTDLFVAFGNPDAETVILVAQGGPDTQLFPAEEVADVLPGLDVANVQVASVHQVQTLDPTRFTETDLTFEQAQAATTESIAHLTAVVDHFRREGKQVLVAGISYGAFVVQELLATQGNVADGYLISVGRIDMPEPVWSVFARGNSAGFVDGVEIAIEEAGMGAVTPVGDRNMNRLAASLGMNRYSEALADTSLHNVVYVSGTLDEQVGRLSDAEVDFLTGAGVDLIQYEGGHGTPDAISAEAVARLLALADG